MYRSGLNETHEATQADPLAGPDLPDDVVTSTQLDPVKQADPGSIIVDHSGDANVG